MKKKFFCFLLLFILFGCTNNNNNDNNVETKNNLEEKELVNYVEKDNFSNSMFSVEGFAKNHVNARDNLKETDDNYMVASNESEFLQGLNLARQNKVNVIEVTNDLDLGWKSLNEIDGNNGKTIYSKLRDKTDEKKFGGTTMTSSIIKETGISEVEINAKHLTIFSKNNSTIKHAMFKIGSSEDIIIRNLSFDEIWQFEDSTDINLQNIGDNDMKSWSYFKVNKSDYIWFDHLTFGKAYDTLIDSENGSKGVTISWCKFLGGNDNEYYTNHMNELEEKYLNGTLEFVFYKYLRDSGLSFEDIFDLYKGQKKGFMIGAGVEPYNSEWEDNKNLELTIVNTYLKDLQDRLPRVRGGSAHIYNVYLDNNDIYETISRIKKYDIYNNLIKGLENKKWHFNLTNQAMVTTNGAGVKFQNSIFEGVEDIIINNNQSEDWLGEPTYYVNPLYTGSYLVEDCIYKVKDLINYRGNSWDLESPFVSKRLTYLNFRWNTPSKSLPYDPTLIEMNDLKDILNQYAGAGKVKIDWLKVNY